MTTRYFRRFALHGLDDVPEGAKVHLGFGPDYLVGTVEVHAPAELPEDECPHGCPPEVDCIDCRHDAGDDGDRGGCPGCGGNCQVACR